MDDYELIDLGEGARLERFGRHVVDRPHPGAYGARGDPVAWDEATLVYVPDTGWQGPGPIAPWSVAVAGLTVELRPTETGQVGLFPEQAGSWAWLRRLVAEHAGNGRPVNLLNLFGYTGAATLVAATAGARVAHVDAARPAVAWGRRNAELSGLSDRPIRWLVDEAAAFVARELRRGNRYDGVVLDPPSYGHGPRGRAWRLEADLAPLLAGCTKLIGGASGFVLLTAHTPGFGGDRLAEELGATLRVAPSRIEAGPLQLTARTGRTLELGAFARWPGAA